MNKIGWCDETWNPVTGCTAASIGCVNCWAKRMATRLRGRCGYPHDDPFRPGVVHVDKLEGPMPGGPGDFVFVCSMGDLFHDDVDDDVVQRVLQRAACTEDRVFLLLTKRPERMRLAFDELPRRLGLMSKTSPPANVWAGVSVEDQDTADERLGALALTRAARRFVSWEPALGPVSFVDNLDWLDWLIVGGENGPNARPAPHDSMLRSLTDCARMDVPFWFKGFGAEYQSDEAVQYVVELMQQRPNVAWTRIALDRIARRARRRR